MKNQKFRYEIQTPDGQVVFTDNITAFAKAHGFSRTTLVSRYVDDINMEKLGLDRKVVAHERSKSFGFKILSRIEI